MRASLLVSQLRLILPLTLVFGGPFQWPTGHPGNMPAAPSFGPTPLRPLLVISPLCSPLCWLSSRFLVHRSYEFGVVRSTGLLDPFFAIYADWLLVLSLLWHLNSHTRLYRSPLTLCCSSWSCSSTHPAGSPWSGDQISVPTAPSRGG